MQKTFIEHITTKRMEKAKKLLKTTDMPSGNIAAEVGYKDPRYFSFVFKKTHFKITLKCVLYLCQHFIYKLD